MQAINFFTARKKYRGVEVHLADSLIALCGVAILPNTVFADTCTAHSD